MVNSKLIKEGEFDQIYQLTKEAVDLVAEIDFLMQCQALLSSFQS